MGKQVNNNDFTQLRIKFLVLAITALVASVILFFLGPLADLRNIDNFKNAYEVEAVPIDTTRPHVLANENYTCVVYEFIDKDGVKQSARMYKQIKREEAEKLINNAETVRLKYNTYLYPLDYKATFSLGLCFTIICFVGSALSFCAFLFAFKGKPKDPNRAVALGRKKIEVSIDGNLIQVFNSPTRLSLLVNGKTVEFFDGMVAPRFLLTTKIKTKEGTKTVSLAMGGFFLRLYCDNVLLAKKFAAFG
ncbi:MAG: hypothetical protein LBQ40_06610 [Clostridiales bacterium]|jgi:hypothetical protein|nr:hypothetical protein [Clostridiales bacterium]